ncbi:MAG: small multi-drug export protein [Phycisphaerae bacterium]|nr:small multi-drug export protein [Phycisphaerae bacterium]
MPEFLTRFFSDPYVLIVLLTFAPALELRASIPYGILVAKLPWEVVVPLAVGANILLGPIFFLLLDKCMHLLLRIGVVNRFWNRMILKTQKKIHPLVEKYGVWGLSVFIGVPLPGSGVYSGAIGGYLLGFTKREFYVATVLGVLIAAAAVTGVVLTGTGAWGLFIKKF